ncbi:MAG: hypothetical protein ACYC99_12290 [Candidatus Geothermincolia bacterium]
MVEVDVFWSYGLGASFALAAFRQIREIEADKEDVQELKLNRGQLRDFKRLIKEIERGDSAFTNQYFLKTLLFLSLLFVPSGSNLLWSNPSWETMQVGSYEKIPGWLVSGFTITNVTQGILGYWVTRNLLLKGEYYKAAQQTIYAYLAFWFILVNGWDKTGYKRFFSKDREAFDNWKPGNVFGFLGSDVMRILLAYGAVFIPLMLYWMTRWLKEGYKGDPEAEWPEDEAEQMKELIKLNVHLLGIVLGWTLGLNIAAHLLIRWLGWTIGGTLATGLIYLAGTSKWGIAPAVLKKIMRVKELEAPAVWDLPRHDMDLEEEPVPAPA